MRARSWIIGVACAGLGVACVTACAAHHGAGAGGFRVFYPDAPAAGFAARVGTRFDAHAVGDCHRSDGSEARWATTGSRVTEGALPPGLLLVDGAISGTPTVAGTFAATITFAGVTCAAAPAPDQHVDVTIRVR